MCLGLFPSLDSGPVAGLGRDASVPAFTIERVVRPAILCPPILQRMWGIFAPGSILYVPTIEWTLFPAPGQPFRIFIPRQIASPVLVSSVGFSYNLLSE